MYHYKAMDFFALLIVIISHQLIVVQLQFMFYEIFVVISFCLAKTDDCFQSIGEELSYVCILNVH